jgi:hypothetical protein
MTDDITGRRLEDVKDNINKDFDVLKSYEDELRSETDTRKMAKYEQEIQRQRESLAQYSKEYEKLKKQAAPAQIQKVSDLLQQQETKLDTIQDLVNKIMPPPELDKLLKRIDRDYNEDKKRQILQNLNWTYTTKGSSYYPYSPPEEYVKSVLSGLKLVEFTGFTPNSLTEEGTTIGAQYVNCLIEKKKDNIINIIHSMPAKALKVILDSPQTTRLFFGHPLFCYPAGIPRRCTLPYSSSVPFSNLFSNLSSGTFLPKYGGFVPAINHIIKSSIYDIFTHFEKSWEIGNIFFSEICKIRLGYLAGTNYMIPEELKKFILPHIKDCNLDNEIRKIRLAAILAGMNKPSDLIYRIIQETESENEIRDIINNLNSLDNSKITTSYRQESPPFFVNDQKKYFEYIDSNIINPVIESIIKK